MRKEDVGHYAILKIRTVALIPADAVEQERDHRGQQDVEDDVGHLDRIPLVVASEEVAVFFVHHPHPSNTNIDVRGQFKWVSSYSTAKLMN